MSMHWRRLVGASASTFKTVPQLAAVPWRIGIVRRYGSVVMGDVDSEVSERS